MAEPTRPRPPKVRRPAPVPRTRSATVDALAPADVPAFWATARLPLVEPTEQPGQVTVTFCWRDADAEAVLLFANRLTDETSLADTLLERLPGSDLWHATFRMSSDWRASYSFLVQRPGEPAPWATDGQVSLRAALDRGRPDPGNPDTCRNRAGVLQSVVSLPDAPAQPWLGSRPDVPRGEVAELAGPDGRAVWVYDAFGLAPDQPAPLIVALDGEVWTSSQSLPTTLDNLVADGAIPPVRAVLPSSGGTEQRWAELGADGDGSSYLVEGLLPWVRSLRSVDPARVVVVGQSLGGLTALRTGLRHPDVVAAVVSQSASLWQDDLAAEVVTAAGSPLRIHLAHGAQEWVLAGPHADLAARLRGAGLTVSVPVVNGGHDYAWWRGDVAEGIRWALG